MTEHDLLTYEEVQPGMVLWVEPKTGDREGGERFVKPRLDEDPPGVRFRWSSKEDGHGYRMKRATFDQFWEVTNYQDPEPVEDAKPAQLELAPATRDRTTY